MAALEGKTALITGGASGIGRATAALFINEGARVVIIDRDQAGLDSVAGEIDSQRLSTCVADLHKAEDIQAYTRHVLETFGRIDAAVFNAGICGYNMPLEDYPEERFDEVLQINLKAVWLGMRGVVPAMKQQKSGSIIFTSSIQGLSALPGTTAYTTSKHALVGMMRGAALELASSGVRVNTVHPGYVSTPMMDDIHSMVSPEAPEEFEKAIAGSVPMQRYARPEEIARLMLFLASDASSYSTGGTFTADGGLLAGLPG